MLTRSFRVTGDETFLSSSGFFISGLRFSIAASSENTLKGTIF
jgi:hypothetical protein